MKTPAAQFSPGQSEIRRRFALLLAVVGLPIAALIATLAWRSYNQAHDAFVRQVQQDLQIRRNGLEQLAVDTHGHIEMLRSYVESRLPGRDALAGYSVRIDWPGQSVNPGPDEGMVLSPPGTMADADRKELEAVHPIFPLLRAAHHARRYLRWSYYFSAGRKFIAIYPWAPPDTMLQGGDAQGVFESYFGYDIFAMAAPNRNTKREPYWTPVYFDAGGAGLMVSHGSPVYDGERFIGMVGTDLLLSHIGEFLSQFPQFPGDVVVIDQTGAVVALPGRAPDDGKAPVKAETILGDLSALPADGRFIETNGRIIGATSIAGTPWRLIVRTDDGAAHGAALASIPPLAAILGAMIAMLGALAFAFRHQFVGPAIALVNFASNAPKNGAETPRVPKPFQPLFDSLRQSKSKNDEYVRQMRTMIDSMPLRVGYVDHQCIYRDINQRLLDFLGKTREEVIGKHLDEILGPMVAEQYRAILPRVMGGETIKWEGWAEFPELGRHYLHRLIMPFAPDGGPSGTLTFTYDATDSEIASQALAEKEALNRAVVNGARDAIIVMDDKGVTLQWNPAAESIFGYGIEEAIGKKVGDLIVPAAMRESHQKGMERYLASGEARVLGRRIELEGMRKDGSLMPVELTITESEIEGRRLFTSHLRDLTQQKAADAELQRTRATLQSIFDNVPAQLYVRELDGTIVLMNKWGAEQIGKTESELIGTNVRDLQVPSQFPAIAAAQERLLATKGPVTGEFRIKYAKRNIRGLTTIFPIKDEAGKITRIGGVIFDIEDRVRAEEQLRQTRATLQSIFDNVPADLYLRNVDGTFVMMNKWGAEQRGLAPEEFVGRSVNEFRLPEEVESGVEAERKLLTTGKPVTGEFQIRYADKVATGLSTIFPVRNDEGEITQIGGVILDVTELRRTREQLASARDSLHQSEKLAALGQLLAGVAHELNNPLAIVLGRASMLMEKLKDTPHAASLQKMREAADRCARIVKTFLAMARQTGPRRRLVQINLLVDGALEMTSYGMRKANVAVSEDLDAALPEIEADEDQIVQVLINLVLNAQQALQDFPGEKKIVVRTRFERGAGKAVVEVADSGPGVPADVAHRIFEPFFTTKAVGEGTGLGLSMCKSMAEAHGGTLTLHETPGGGATFRLSLPASAARRVAAADTMALPGQAGRGRVLIVDDEPEIAAILADTLSAIGFETDIATDGKDALEKIGRAAFDAIFCDVSMPGMDGLTMYNKLKERNPLLAGKLVFVSGDVLHRDWERIKATVDRPVIEKPFDPELVRRTAIEIAGAMT